jgi:salicylate hydroxylase
MSASRIVIAGAGIGGLTAALCLARAGKAVTLFERAEKIEEVGAGLQISPNAGRVLAGLGLEPELAAVGLEPRAIAVRRADDGRTLARLPLVEARDMWGAPFRVFHRADLQQALLDAARKSDLIEIQTSSRVGDFEEIDGSVLLRVHGAEGMRDVEASGLVGADGVRSSVRGGLVRSPKDTPRHTGYVAWRALIPARSAPPALRAVETQLWLGAGAHVVHYPLRDASVISVVVVVPENCAQNGVDESFTIGGAALLQSLAGKQMNADLGALIEAGESWRRWPLFRRRVLSRWSTGAVTLLGDAAHPMLPFLAQGAAQAIEDADALGRAFDNPNVTVYSAFNAYQHSRMRRAHKVQRRSLAQAAYVHMGGIPAMIRDLAIKSLGDRGMLMRNAWIYR